MANQSKQPGLTESVFPTSDLGQKLKNVPPKEKAVKRVRGSSKDIGYNIQNTESRVNRAVVVVWPFLNRFTNYNLKWDTKFAMAVGNPVFLENYVVVLNTRSNKRAHTSQSTVVLKDVDNIINQVSTNDWMAIWMVDTEEDQKRLRAAIKSGKPANAFRDGLKFLGRVGSLNRDLVVDPRMGRIQKRLTIAGMGFVEFDSMVYFDPALELKADQAPTLFWQRLSTGLRAVNNLDNTDVNTAISTLVNIFLGGGPNPDVKGKGDVPYTPNTSFLVPTQIARVFGVTAKDEEAPGVTYSALLHTIYGVQQYPGNLPNQNAPWAPFIPRLEGISVKGRRQYWTGRAMQGKFGAQVNAWPGVPVWGVLSQFLNPSMNEMYTCLRVNPQGEIVPSLIVRQIPFTTEELLIGENNQAAITRFLSLPRWRLPTAMLMQASTSKTSALRVNMVQVTNIPPPGSSGKLELSQQRANSPPLVDYNDLLRNGLACSIQTTNTFQPTMGTNDAKSAPARFWTWLAADRMMGGHLKWSGQFVVKGIVEPICEGDNLQVEDIVYHIEAINHQMTVSQENGAISWETTIAVSNGVPANGLPVPGMSQQEFDLLDQSIQINVDLNDPEQTIAPGTTMGGGVVA